MSARLHGCALAAAADGTADCTAYERGNIRKSYLRMRRDTHYVWVWRYCCRYVVVRSFEVVLSACEL